MQSEKKKQFLFSHYKSELKVETYNIPNAFASFLCSHRRRRRHRRQRYCRHRTIICVCLVLVSMPSSITWCVWMCVRLCACVRFFGLCATLQQFIFIFNTFFIAIYCSNILTAFSQYGSV